MISKSIAFHNFLDVSGLLVFREKLVVTLIGVLFGGVFLKETKFYFVTTEINAN